MSFIASNPGSFNGQVIGSGQCVAFVQAAAGAPNTAKWKQGARVRANSSLPAGTAIATFDAYGRYANKTDGSSHAAIYVKQDGNALHVWDQWSGQAVHVRPIQFRGGGKAVNDGDQYCVIEPRPELPADGHITLEQFVEFTGWATPSLPGSMHKAFRFLQRHVPSSVLMRVVKDPAPWSLPAGGPVYWLTTRMQSFDFMKPVDVVKLAPNQVLLAYMTDPDGQPGNYFTTVDTPMDKLAIPKDQVHQKYFHPTAEIEALRGSVSDTYVDWARHRGIAAEYRHGGGEQFFIWDSGHLIQPVVAG